MTASSLIIGKTALQASQLALQVAGNNIANATTPGYSRQRAEQVVTASQEIQRGVFIGRGVGVQEVRRLVDEALQTRVRSASSDEMAASVSASIMDSIESITNELSGNDISTRLDEFFNAFSELANNPALTATRAAVLETAGRLTGQIRAVRSDFVELREQVDADIRATVEEVNGLLQRIAKLNDQIVDSEIGAGENPGLRDQRDALLDELSQQIDIAVIPQSTGAVRVLVGSEPLVEGDRYRELRVNEQFNTTTQTIDFDVRTVDDGTTIFPSGGRLGALIEERDTSVQRNIDELDTFAAQLVFEVNRLHAQGDPDIGLTTVTSSMTVPAADQILALNDPANLTFSNLPMQARNGSFPVVVTDTNGNRVISTPPIEVDLDGILAGGGAGFTDDTSFDDIVNAINAVSPNINAYINPNGQLQVDADPGFTVSFAYFEDNPGSDEQRLINDTSGVLAILGVHNLLDGTDAATIDLAAAIDANPQLLSVGPANGSNETALGLATLREAPITAFNDISLAEQWQQQVERNAVNTAGAASRFEALSAVRQNLEAQDQAVSGVSLDEESIALITYQQQYTGAARFISVVDELTQVLLGLV